MNEPEWFTVRFHCHCKREVDALTAEERADIYHCSCGRVWRVPAPQVIKFKPINAEESSVCLLTEEEQP